MPTDLEGNQPGREDPSGPLGTVLIMLRISMLGIHQVCLIGASADVDRHATDAKLFILAYANGVWIFDFDYIFGGRHLRSFCNLLKLVDVNYIPARV